MLSIIIPTYNEAENIEPLLTGLKVQTEHEIIIVDDNSPDGTASIVEKLKGRFPNLRLVKRAGKKGLAGAVVEGAKTAKGDILLVMDADLSHPPEIVPKMAKALEKSDIVVGSRSAVQSWPLHRKAISKGAETIARILLHVKCSDPLSGLFAIRKSVFDNTRFRVKGYKILLNILYDNRNITVAEVSYLFKDRHAGKTKLGFMEMLTYLLDVMRLRLK